MPELTKIPVNDLGGNAGQASVALQVELASRTVPPLWPLDGAIAVNPLAGFEEIAFDKAMRAAGGVFRARAHLALPHWRMLCEKGQLDANVVRNCAIERLGGLEAAFDAAGPDITLADCLWARLFDLDSDPPAASLPDPSADLVAGWCAVYFDAGTSAMMMPGRGRGLFAAVSPLMRFSPKLKRARRHMDSFPKQPLPAIGWVLDTLAIPRDKRPDHLAATVARLPGWAGHIRWRTEHADTDQAEEAPATMADLIALLLLCDVALGRKSEPIHAKPREDLRAQLARHFNMSAERFDPRLQPVLEFDEADLGLIFQEAAERAFGDPLARTIERKAAAQTDAGAVPDAQLVFCIDVRSEPMRRAIEDEGPYDTVGYAGFFGLLIAVKAPNRRRMRQLPVLVAPQHDLGLSAVEGAEKEADDYLGAQKRSDAARSLFGQLKAGAATTFSTAEATGPAAAALMIARTLIPQTMRRFDRKWNGNGQALSPEIDRQVCGSGLTPGERLAYAKTLFALTGMKPKARLIAFIGHRGEAINNPYAAALDCGACAGHGGAPNARVMAMILNDPAVRQALAIPDECWFLAGEHNTTTDAVELFDLQLAPTGYAGYVAALRHSLAKAGNKVRAVRAGRLRRSAADLSVGACHWGEVRPEWGLAGNAAFIVGPRALTKGIDLEGRSFLHDYDWQSDGDGEALATILTAPMVVAQWINCQYLFSTLDNERYGAGDKIVHNPVGRIGVLRGNGGDLAIGLPRQSLFHDDGCPAHIPQRLTTIIFAPEDRVETVIESHAVLQRLFGNGWVKLVIVDPHTRRARRRLADAERYDPKGSSGPFGTEERYA